MKIQDRIHLVGSGRLGFDLTEPYDCHVYLLDGGSECALIDAGAGLAPDQIVARIEEDGLDPARVRTLLLTHAHADHAGGAAAMRERLGLTVGASPEVARMVRAGDARAISLAAAKRSGSYPDDYIFRACPVDTEVTEGDHLRIGDLTVEAVATPGHAAGQLTWVLREGGHAAAFCGDTLFAGGRILLQDTWDCSVQESCRSVEKLAALDIDGFYPGHLTFAVQRGRRHVEAAMANIRQLLPPDQLA